MINDFFNKMVLLIYKRYRLLIPYFLLLKTFNHLAYALAFIFLEFLNYFVNSLISSRSIQLKALKKYSFYY